MLIMQLFLNTYSYKKKKNNISINEKLKKKLIVTIVDSLEEKWQIIINCQIKKKFLENKALINIYLLLKPD